MTVSAPTWTKSATSAVAELSAKHGALWNTGKQFFDVVEISPLKWRWTIYPKKSSEVGRASREVAGNRQEAIAQCKLEIDRKLERRRAQGS
jgi:hypothetical protein